MLFLQGLEFLFFLRVCWRGLGWWGWFLQCGWFVGWWLYQVMCYVCNFFERIKKLFEINVSVKMEFFIFLRCCVNKKKCFVFFWFGNRMFIIYRFYIFLNEVEVEMVGRGCVGGNECVGCVIIVIFVFIFVNRVFQMYLFNFMNQISKKCF